MNENPFAWLTPLLSKPVVVCLACHHSYFPHLGGCDLGCTELESERFNRLVLSIIKSERYWKERSVAH